jgi:hypothetical protein
MVMSGRQDSVPGHLGSGGWAKCGNFTAHAISIPECRGRVRSDFLQFLTVGAFYVIIMGIAHGQDSRQ